MKTLDELKQQHPALFALHEMEVTKATESRQGLADAFLSFVGELADTHKIALGLTDADTKKLVDEARSETAKQVALKQVDIDRITADLKAANDKVAALEGEVTTFKEATVKAEADKKSAERRAALAEALPKTVKDNPYAEAIKPMAEKEFARDDFDVKALESFVKSKTDEYAAVKPAKNPAWDIEGADDLAESDDPDEPKIERGKPVPGAKEVAESLRGL